MPFPTTVHSVISDANEADWPVEGQGINECGCTAAANALNIVSGDRRFNKDEFVREASVLFQRKLGGTPSPVTGWLIQRHGFGTHFGNLSHTDYERVLCDLIDRHIPVVVELGAFRIGNQAIYGEHSIVLVGYNNASADPEKPIPSEFYFVDSQWPEIGKFTLTSNNRDSDGDGQVDMFPGNRTLSRDEFNAAYPMRFYFPVFETQAEHDEWYHTYIQVEQRIPLLGDILAQLLTGSYDLWRNE